MAARLKKTLHFLALLAVFLLAGEFASRVDDWIHLGVPLLANPERSRDLTVVEAWGFRGKPNGSFRKWKARTS